MEIYIYIPPENITNLTGLFQLVRNKENLGLKSESHFRTQFVIISQTRWLPCHMRLFPEFLKLVLNIFILHNLITGWVRRLLKRGLIFWIKSIDWGEALIVRGSSIHQSKNWYYLGSFQTYRLELFASIDFGHKLITFAVQGSNLDVWLVL